MIMKAILTDKMTGERYECTATSNHPDSSHGLKVWVDADGTALQQVEVPEFLQNSLRYDVEVTHLTIIDKIERIMQARGITTYKLAQISGVNRQTIDNALAEDGNPTLSTLNSMCDALGYTLEIVEKI